MKHIFLISLLLLSLVGLSCVYADSICSDLSDNLIRLHVVANSNSEFDQKVKIAVRDELLKVSGSNPQLHTLEKTAQKVLDDMNAGYGSTVSFLQRHVPKKQYKSIQLPEGEYSCINVVLGNGSGENWWCIAYPPLCFTEEVFGDLSKEGRLLLQNNLDSESFRTILYNGDINIRFRLVEEIQKLKNRLFKS